MNWTELLMGDGSYRSKSDQHAAKPDQGEQSLGQSMWGVQRADYGLPKHLERALITRRMMVLWGSLFLMAYAIAPGLFPQVTAFIEMAEVGLKEPALRVFSFMGGSFALTWLADRGWREEESED